VPDLSKIINLKKILAIQKRLAYLSDQFDSVKKINEELFHLKDREKSTTLDQPPIVSTEALKKHLLEQSLDTEIVKKIRWSIDFIKTKHFNQNLIDFVREYLELTFYPGTIANTEGIIPILSKEVLTKVYTPGVAKICLLIEALRSEARDLRDIASFLPTTGKEKLKVQKEILNRTEYINATVLALSFTNAAIHINRITNFDMVKRRISLIPNPVLIITDNTAVLGLGDIGTYAGIPVMVGKKMIMNYFGNINAIPISIETRDPKEIIEIVKMIAPTEGAINLEDISAPRCFEIEKQLDQDLKIPVFHDDQHGTAIVVVAALLNALKVTKRQIENTKVFINGAGAAGLSIAELILTMGVKSSHLMVADTKGIIYEGRPDGMNSQKEIIAKMTNPLKLKGKIEEGIVGMDVFIGVSSKNILSIAMVKTMHPDSIIFAMANPDPEILPEDAKKGGAKIIGTGRSDYPNQVNNALAFPGLLRGALESKHKINLEMKKMTALLIAKWAEPKLSAEYILPSPLDLKLHEAIADEITKKFS